MVVGRNWVWAPLKTVDFRLIFGKETIVINIRLTTFYNEKKYSLTVISELWWPIRKFTRPANVLSLG